MKKHLLILSTLVLVSGKTFAADGSVSVENQTGNTIIVEITDSILDLKKLGKIPSATGDATSYVKTGELTIKDKHQWVIPTKKTKRTVIWTIINPNVKPEKYLRYKTAEAYNPLDGIVIYGDKYIVKKSALGAFSKEQISGTPISIVSRTSADTKKEIEALKKEYKNINEELQKLETTYKAKLQKLPKAEQNKLLKEKLETKTTLSKELKEITEKLSDLQMKL